MNLPSHRSAVRMSVLLVLVFFGVVLWMAPPSAAVSPATVQQAAEADFGAGELHSVEVTSAGEIRLGRTLDFLMRSEKAPNVVSALALRGKTLFVASGGDNAIYRIRDGKADKDKFATVPGTMTGSLLAGDKDLIAGVNGDKGAGIYRIDDKGKVTPFWSNPDVKYVWAILAAGGKFYAATGPKGQVWSIDAAGKGEKIFEAKDLAKNILCLAKAGDGTLYAGTDERGLVIAIDPVRKTSHVLLGAPEKEVSAIVPLPDGSVYVATSDSAKAASEPGGETAETEHKGASQSAPTSLVVLASTKPAGKPASTPAAAPAEDGDTSEPSDDSGTATKAGSSSTTGPAASHGPKGSVAPPGGGESAEGGLGIEGPGNAVYRIAPDGLVRPLFRKAVSIFAMIKRDNELILATGNSGQIIAVKLSGEESTIIADTDASQITCLAAGDGGKLYFGTANKGSVGELGDKLARTGTFVSKAVDAQQIARWGTIRVRANVPDKAKLTVSTRTGNLAEPKDNTWSGWSDETPVTDGFLQIASLAGRFLQYRLTFTADGDGPKAGDVRIVYQVGNLAPEIASVQIVPSATEEGGGSPVAPPPAAPSGAHGETAALVGPQYFRNVAIQAVDPNSDQMIYTVEYRQVGGDNWVKIAEKLDKPQYTWDSRTVSDGTYEFRVTASDSPSNPPSAALTATKISTPVVVDNTPPVVKELAAKVDGVKVSAAGLVTDSGSRIASIHYSLDSATEWTTILPEDGICDGDKEKFSFELKDVKPGAHRLTVKAVDAFGNAGYQTVTVQVAK